MEAADKEAREKNVFVEEAEALAAQNDSESNQAKARILKLESELYRESEQARLRNMVNHK